MLSHIRATCTLTQLNTSHSHRSHNTKYPPVPNMFIPNDRSFNKTLSVRSYFNFILLDVGLMCVSCACGWVLLCRCLCSACWLGMKRSFSGHFGIKRLTKILGTGTCFNHKNFTYRSNRYSWSRD